MLSNSLRLTLIFLAPVLLSAQSLKDFEKRVTEFTLGNGMHFIILERHEAPVVSFHSYVNAGSVDDPSGETGIAHMFEHMAFKGTETIGTTNWPPRRRPWTRWSASTIKYDAERNKGVHADPKKFAELAGAAEGRHGEGRRSTSMPNEYPRIIEENGGVGMNAGTGEDSTNYFYNFPRNRLELWFLLESQRFYDPVFREFYKERDVVREERRMRIESSPQGKLVEMLLATAFAAHPYRNSPAGWASDIENLPCARSRADSTRNITCPPTSRSALPATWIRRNASGWRISIFRSFRPGRCRAVRVTVEPPQQGEKRVQVESPAQPFMVIAYKRPDQNDKDDPVFDVLGEILAGGRTGLLYTELVRDKQIALGALAQPTFPGGKYPNLFLFFLVPNSRAHRGGEREGLLRHHRAAEDRQSGRGDVASASRPRFAPR